MAEIIHESDLPAAIRSHELILALVAGANAKASRVAPCLADTPSAAQVAEARLVLIGAVKRWAEAGAGSLQSETAGVFSHTIDTRQRTGFNLWPSEIVALQDICKTETTSRAAFEIDTTPTDPLAGYSSLGLSYTSDTTGATYWSSDLGYLDTPEA